MDLFTYLRVEMKKLVPLCEGYVEDAGIRQDPVIFVPEENPSIASAHPVCCLCGPPCAPDPPFIVKCTPNSALLEWSMPPFDGVPPTHYKVYMRNDCRLYYDWSVVPGADFVNYELNSHKAVRYNVSHLPAGVRVEFCISAYNRGGWGLLSKASLGVIPGEELQPQSLRGEWKKITKGGPLAVIDRLTAYPEHRLEHILGLKLLITFAHKEGAGFSRMNIREKVCGIVIHALRTFPQDGEICSACFTLVGYCMHGKLHKQLKRELIKDGLMEELEKCMKVYRNDSAVMNSIQWLRKAMPNDVPPNCSQALIPFGRRKREDEEEDV
jgi:hypothetical protein